MPLSEHGHLDREWNSPGTGPKLHCVSDDAAERDAHYGVEVVITGDDLRPVSFMRNEQIACD
ncbi:MAG: hypothetical protein HN742_40070 [Lentisphaerae bacterium]|nr:hypothetical protein [Lentisphaerota bacterium]MBT5605098.1 hypothetical protein [Lentisphaerota bacterium]MBT7055980.1 hypothetical protein [Lentisphaerota bacterium]MBT7848133.1 hypothetical protein [Lentisphaerota bacterium]